MEEKQTHSYNIILKFLSDYYYRTCLDINHIKFMMNETKGFFLNSLNDELKILNKNILIIEKLAAYLELLKMEEKSNAEQSDTQADF